jgi:hypothetical protein
MDAIIVSELDKIIASLEVIENQLTEINASEDAEAEIRSEFPPMPFPAFD